MLIRNTNNAINMNMYDIVMDIELISILFVIITLILILTN